MKMPFFFPSHLKLSSFILTLLVSGEVDNYPKNLLLLQSFDDQRGEVEVIHVIPRKCSPRK